MRGEGYTASIVIFLISLLFSSAAFAQKHEQLIGFENNKIYCKLAYEMKIVGKGEFVITADYTWLRKKGEETDNPGICLDLVFDKKPLNSVKITPLSSAGLYNVDRTEVKYLIKVTDDQQEILLSVDPILCKAPRRDKRDKDISINKSIPKDIAFTIPAGILSPQHFSRDHLPDIVLVNEIFSDDNQNNLINAGENTHISFDIPNLGVGIAHNVEIHMSISNELYGLQFPAVTRVGDINPGDTARVELSISGDMELVSGLAEFKIEARERNGFHAFPLYMKIETMEYYPPDVFFADFEFSTEGSDKIRMNYPINLKVIIQNKGRGEASEYKVQFKFINNYCLNLTENPEGVFDVPVLNSGEYEIIDYLFIITRAYEYETIPIKLSILDGYKHVKDTIISVGLQEALPDRITSIYAEKPVVPALQIMSFTSFVDKDIPETGYSYDKRFALVIGNENYAKYQRGLETESNVVYANNDARVFKEYACKTLGVPEGNAYLLLNATAGEMQQKINLVSKRAEKAGPDSEIIIYYAGHGYPDEESRNPYLMPVDVTAKDLSLAIKLSDMLYSLSESGAAKIIVFLDACFSGGGRNSGLLAARGVRIKPHEGDIPDKVLLFSASSSTQSALPYNDEFHGLFTYYLLEKLWTSSGDVTYGELFDYLQKEVPDNSLRINEKEQDPDVRAGNKVIDLWRTWNLR